MSEITGKEIISGRSETSGTRIPEMLAEKLSDERYVRALESLLDTLVAMEESGLLSLMKGLSDRDLISGVNDLLIGLGTLRLLDNFDKIQEALAKLDYDKLPKLVELLNRVAEALEREHEPAGILDLLKAGRDPNVRKSLGLLLEIARELGKADGSV